MAKTFGLTPEYVLHEMSYANMLLYSASLPAYRKPKTEDKKTGKQHETIDAGDPRNKNRVREFLDAMD